MINNSTALYPQKKPGDSIAAFLKLLAASSAQLHDAAAMLCRLQSEDENTIAQIIEAQPSCPAAFLAKLLRVGERSLHPDLLLNGCPAYLRLSSLPFSTQENILRAGSVDLVTNAESGDLVRAQLVDLTASQVSQVITPAGVRTRDQQRAYLKRRNVRGTEEIVGPIYKITRQGVTIFRPCEITRADLARILGEMVA
jgi:hypothetical protein